MSPLPAGLAGRFAAVAARCGSGKAIPPAAVCRVAAGTLTVTATSSNGVAVQFAAPTDAADVVLVLPFDVLSALAAARGPVELRSAGGRRAEAVWADAAGPKTLPFTALKPGRHHALPPAVTDWVPGPPSLLAALHACGKAAARGGGTPRFALDRVCLSGVHRRVIGSDGKAAVLAGPFPMPFADDRLVPAVPVFGSAELTAQTDVAVGVADGIVAVKAGPWCVRLPVLPGRYPDVPAVIPKSRPTVGRIDDADARELVSRLPALPGRDDPDGPVTELLAGGVAVLAADENRTGRVLLPKSSAAGPAARAAVPRTVLARALKLGCLDVKVWAADRPVAFEGGLYTVLAAPLGPDAVVADAAVAGEGSIAAPDVLNLKPQTRRSAMRPSEPTRPVDTDGPSADPLAEAEDLRAALADALSRATRLVARLRGRKKEQKALATVWTSLKSLGLDREGRP